MVRLGDVVKIEASSKSVVGDKFWLLNLDMVEQQTGNVIAYNYVGKDALNGSIIQFDTGCVLYSKLRPNLNKVVIPGQDGFATSEMLPLRPNTKLLTREYLTAFLRSDNFVTWAVSKTAGAKMPRLGSKELLGKEIPLPSISEQTHIAGQFAKVDELIALRKEQLAKLDQLVKSRFSELFGSVEDNVFGFETIKIKDACDLINGKAFKPEDWSDVGLPIVRIQNLNNDQAPFNFFNGEIKEQYLIDTGELLFSWSGTPGTSFGAFFWNRGKAVLNQHIFRVKPKIDFNLSFLQFALNGRIDHIISKAHGGVGLQHITKKELDEVELLLPVIEFQNQFAAFVEQTDKSKLAIQQSLDKLELLKKSLMQEYFG